jgi:hypothetical protein
MGSLLGLVAVLVGVLVVAMFFVGVFLGGPIGALSIVPAMFCGILIFVIALIAVGALGGTSTRRIPPPPPIQQPLVPAGQQGPVELACPNCGGPPQFVDRFGIATCAYCGTRFLVR